jgi:hypothetical protein
MSVETDIQKDIRARILAEVPGVSVFDRHAFSEDPNPYVVFGPTQRVANHAKEARYSIYYVTLHLWTVDSSGSIATRDLASEIIEAVDMHKLPSANLDAYFEDSLSVYEDDESTNHVVISFQVR